MNGGVRFDRRRRDGWDTGRAVLWAAGAFVLCGWLALAALPHVTRAYRGAHVLPRAAVSGLGVPTWAGADRIMELFGRRGGIEEAFAPGAARLHGGWGGLLLGRSGRPSGPAR